MKCHDSGCKIEFGPTHHKYKCSKCKNYYCDDHACNPSYIRHFRGLRLLDIDKAVKDDAYLCQPCFAAALKEHNINIPEYEKSIFGRKCGHPECNKSLVRYSKYSCISCGKNYCDNHSLDIEKRSVSPSWRESHTRFYSAERVCTLCYEQKNAEYKARDVNHPNTTFLKLMAGKHDGKRIAIIVHGILSDYKSMAPLSNALVENGIFDTVWAFNDIAYNGRVNESMTFGPSDFLVDPKKLVISLGKFVVRKAMEVTNLPAYIVEGAAQALYNTIISLELKDITLIGHSLGGIVVRCTAESYDLTRHTNKIITIASPHSLWLNGVYGFRGNKNNLTLWNGSPKEGISYLGLLGRGDWVALESFSEFCEDYSKFKIIRISIDGDHTSIHNNPHGNYAVHIIKSFVLDTDDFYVIRSDDNTKKTTHYLKIKPINKPVPESGIKKIPTDVMLEFKPGD